MNRLTRALSITLLLTAFPHSLFGHTDKQTGGPAKQAALDTSKIEQITGLKGTYNKEEDVFKVSSPRGDAKISVDDWTMPPFMGLTSWAAFTHGSKGNVMVMGDLVLFQDEVNPVMSALLDSGVDVTALHNHFFYDDPKVFFMHLSGDASLETLATGVRKAFDTVKEVRSHVPSPAKNFGKSIPGKNSITAKPLEDVFGVKAQVQNGMAKVTIGRTTKMPCGCTMGKEMGVNTWAAFAGTDDDAVVDGDFAMRETELQNVLKSLRHENINIVAIHHHMSQEEPRILFLHYWGRGKAVDLAKAVHAALQTQQLKAQNTN